MEEERCNEDEREYKSKTTGMLTRERVVVACAIIRRSVTRGSLTTLSIRNRLLVVSPQCNGRRIARMYAGLETTCRRRACMERG